ncbi:MAG: hypothetical protein EOS10_33930 [Mesorhizobium sp.]|uniref:hypothetical protein n=1 Tax=Mesorhizobium sp. TaxID=1871066 RepID=UPI000FE65BE8|nr:hypothetical protein [Mesorhizobium sp.]RWO23245.1 MAG: hypothetical protein EOS10_33930 [Mesorhizobium sp.]
MTSAAFVSAVLALLLTPGPTNTLMGLAAARNGMRSAVRLLPAELFGYLTAIMPLTWLGAEIVANFPSTAIVLKIAAAAWVMYLAVWRMGCGTGRGREVTPKHIYVTTILNPKVLIFGLFLLPSAAAQEFLPKLGLFSLLAVAVALVWGTLGRLTRIGGGGDSRLIVVERFASAWLAIVSATLIAGTLLGWGT